MIKKYFILSISVFCFICTTAFAQRIEIAAMPDTRNENGIYTSYASAIENAAEVKKLILEKEEADIFLRNPHYFPHIESININFSKRGKVESLAKLETLKKLYIRYSWYLRILPADLTSIPHLELLSISNCGIETLPSDFFNNPKIEVISICQNQLKTLPPIPSDNNLKKLYLGINQLEKLPEDIAHLKKLELLDIKHLGLKEFPCEIFPLHHLKTLDISSNEISFLPPQVAKMKSLEELYLIKTKITKLPKELKSSSLKLLMMSDKGLTEKQKKAIKKALPKDCRIEWRNQLNHVIDINNDNCECAKHSWLIKEEED